MNNGNGYTLGAALRSFLGDYLPHQRAYSVNTILSYRDSLKLLLQFAAGKRDRVSELSLADLNVAMITAFVSISRSWVQRRKGRLLKSTRMISS